MGFIKSSSEAKGVPMSKIVIRLEPLVKRQLRRLKQKTKEKGLAIRCQIILLAAKGRKRGEIAEFLGCSVSWVNRVVARFHDCGVAGLMDRREDNGDLKLDESFLAKLHEIVDGSPQDHGFLRPTWTLELLARVMYRLSDVQVHPATMSRALALIGARLGRPKPTVGCPWSPRRKNRRLAEIRRVLDHLPRGHVAVYLDEVDVHLNPKIGPDWTNRGKQKTVLTPGSNVKRYLCGALDAKTQMLVWVRGERKNSLLFITMLHKLVQAYPAAKAIHVVLDNFRIHDSKVSRAAVEALGGKVVLHWLPPYCPDHNKIERTWLDLHANVTRNHTCADMDELMRRVSYYLIARNNRTRSQAKQAA
jgi:transposase